MRIAYLGSPRSQLGIAGGTAALVGSIIQAGVQLTMATVQLVYSEIQERRARKQFERDQAKAREQALVDAQRIQDENDQLRAYLISLQGGGPQPTPVTGSITGILAHPYLPYAAIGGALLFGFLLLRRR